MRCFPTVYRLTKGGLGYLFRDWVIWRLGGLDLLTFATMESAERCWSAISHADGSFVLMRRVGVLHVMPSAGRSLDAILLVCMQ